MSDAKNHGPPQDLTQAPKAFWSVGEDLDALSPPPLAETKPVLQRLGPLPFPRGKFPLMGFLATVYDQIAAFAGQALGASQEDGRAARRDDGPDGS